MPEFYKSHIDHVLFEIFMCKDKYKNVIASCTWIYDYYNVGVLTVQNSVLMIRVKIVPQLIYTVNYHKILRGIVFGLKLNCSSHLIGQWFFGRALKHCLSDIR